MYIAFVILEAKGKSPAQNLGEIREFLKFGS
jgi:hypothetical protein